MRTTLLEKRQVAIEAVLKATELARRMQGTLEALDVVSKEDFSPVTITDFSCQAIISRHLLASFPSIPIMGEEDTFFLRDVKNEAIKKKVVQQIHTIHPEIDEHEILSAIDRGGYEGGSKGLFWTIDPIDGTKGFIRNEQYAIALALIEEGEVVLGLLSCPRLVTPGHKKGGLFIASKGEGAQLFCFDTQKMHPVHVNTNDSPLNVIYCEPFPTPPVHSSVDAAKIAAHLGASPKPFRLDSQVKYGVIATGDASIYLRVPSSDLFREKIWDHAAGKLIVEEAGGKVTDLEGRPLDFSRGKTLANNLGVLATNGLLHDKVIDSIQAVLFKNNP